MADDPQFRRWLPNQPLEHNRLNAMQDRPITEVRAGPGILLQRKGNSLTISLVKRLPPPINPGRVAMVRITATEDGGGKYGGVLLDPPTAPTDTDSVVSQADLGDVGDEIYIINAAERDQNTHDLSLIEGDRPKDFLAIYRYADPADGKPTYAIESMQFNDCETGGVSGGSNSYSPSMTF